MRVHYLQHVPFEGLGYIDTWLKAHRHTVTGTAFFEPGSPLPDTKDIDALIVMGGPMGVYDATVYPWLIREKSFIKDCLAAHKRILGICLGAQLLADCLGARVHPAPHKEIGWFAVRPTPPAARGTTMPSWLPGLFKDEPTVFHWHGDQFDIPPGAADTLSTAANTAQAFQWNDRVLGLQFHLEVTPELLDQMIAHGTHELIPSPYIQPAEALRAGNVYMASCHRLMGHLLKTWMGEGGL
ncbi:type 1 glutamine amidotransferase [Dinghuibacter silviterrae]|uniref:GMP synthase-like glutamine amidotransferase n=1 Tax=Dinghuibacter silviterrae TaxID=1539049 RepID=A0A4R8DG71_9BACT|nr:type 1 glutamine amidotransferase [Dinghuibacter silviterrae]TDW95960.1 GMP synthase-like glutamine amidotransferase [Dinghuibacter silviterrae]